MKYAILITLATALTGCPMITTSESRVDVPAALELFEAHMQRRATLRQQITDWSEEKTRLQAAPVGSSGPNPRIQELAELIQNNLNLMAAEDTMLSGVVGEAVRNFRDGGTLTVTFQPEVGQ